MPTIEEIVRAIDPAAFDLSRDKDDGEGHRKRYNGYARRRQALNAATRVMMLIKEQKP